MKKRLTFSVLIILILLTSAIAYASSNIIIVSPEILEGISGQTIEINEIFVQEVTLTQAKFLDVKIVDSANKEITKFPNTSGKYTLVNKANNQKVGFIELKVIDDANLITTGTDLKGQYLFYQEGKVFNNIKSAKEGNLYFWKKPANPNARPMILNIGNVSSGIFQQKSYVVQKGNTLELKK